MLSGLGHFESDGCFGDLRMRKQVLYTSAAGLVLFLRCAHADTSIPFEVKWAAFQGPANPTRLAIVSREQWLQFWTGLRIDQARFMHGPTESAEQSAARHMVEAPDIDFTKYTVIVAGAGTKPTGGFTISIRNITESNDSIRVTIVETKPGHDCAGTAVPTAPFVGALIPATTKKVTFDTVAVETDCR
jgi:hypothetical protein